MRQWIARQMMRPWVYRIGCMTIFVAVMYALRSGLIALKDTHDLPLIAAVCVPIIVGCNVLAQWLDRRGY